MGTVGLDGIVDLGWISCVILVSGVYINVKEKNVYIHYIYKSMWTPLQISGFVHFSNPRC